MLPIALLILVGAQPQPLQVRSPAELAEDRFALACRAKEDAQDRYNRGLANSEQLLAWDERVLEAYLATCDRKDDRLKGLQFHLDRATAVQEFEKRRVEAKGGTLTPEFLEANYTLHWAAQRLALEQKNSAAARQAGQRQLQAAQDGLAESVNLLKAGKISIEKPLLWSNRALHAAWIGNEAEAAHHQAVADHLARMDTVEAALKLAPAPRGRPPIIDAATELAYRRAELELWQGPPAEFRQRGKKRAELSTKGRDLVVEAFRKDKVAVEPVLIWLERWRDDQEILLTDPSALEKVLEEQVRLLREMELLARQHQQEGSRYISDADYLTLAYERLGAEQELALHRKRDQAAMP